LSFDACFPDSIVGFETCPLMNRDYLYYVFSCMKQEFLREAPVNTQGNLNVERLGTQTVPCPPLSEQQKIVINIEGKIKSLGECIDNFRLEIDLLREYRTRLIADVVTGKLDVTGVKIEQGDGETDFLEDFEENEAEIDSDKEIDAMEGVNE
ncbi:MAG: restriction endonuclease subunit S, partial [Pseudomonadota bacterium]